MEFKDCVQFANENPTCYLSSTDGDQPHVRALLMWHADETGFYFIILAPKEMSKQLKANPKLELCFYNNPPTLETAKMLRVTGKAEFVTDPEMLKRAYEERKFLEGVAGRSLEDITEVVRVGSGDAHFWTMMDVMKESQLEHIQF
ncbi:MAG: pyridoxamine 5'-phosphate oxidase family protein [Anaerolineae bacterium]|nr:pyridoxamine 5'-phosphate oxidase family protein [Anaerolineae bacterium]